jgi:hypothetical protein
MTNHVHLLLSGQAGLNMVIFFEFLVTAIPPYKSNQSRVKKKWPKWNKFNTPGQYPLIEKLSTTNMPRKARFFIPKIPVQMVIRGNSRKL